MQYAADLIKHNAYCPVHRSVSACHRLSAQERFLCKKEPSLVCDQRYAAEDMGRMVELIRGFLKGKQG